ncbi:bruno 1 isoform b-related [Citrus sinensis]|nr:bruno 1 isoform b-related [Citrus sinensis]
MEGHVGEYITDPPEFNPNSFSGNYCSWSSDDHRHNFPDNYHSHHRRHYQYDQMSSEPTDFFNGQPMPFIGRKRGFNHPAPDHINDSGIPAKLYVAPVPRTATEEDIRPLFEEHGNVIEVVLPKDKRTGQQQGYCFVKFTIFEEAGNAIRALNGHYIFPGEQASIKVRFADGEREHPVAPPDKLYVGCLSKQTSKKEIEEVFSPYGHIEDIFIVRDELKQSRDPVPFEGCAFVQFSHREMALAAISGLNGTFTMRGSDQPLVVRIADPKKPRTGELRGNYTFGTPSFGPNFLEPVRPPPNLGNSAGGQILPNVSYRPQHIFNNSHPQVFSNWGNQEAATPIIQQLHCSQQQSSSQLSQLSLQQIQIPQQNSQLSQQAVSDMQKQLHLRQSSTQNVEQQQNSHVIVSESESQGEATFDGSKLSFRTFRVPHVDIVLGLELESPRSGNNPQTSASASTIPTVPQSPQVAASPECDWSEHTCPDGNKYYYNCETCESRWDKPEEYLLFEQQIEKQQKLQNGSQSVSSTKEVAQTQEVQLQPHVFRKKVQLQDPSVSASAHVDDRATNYSTSILGHVNLMFLKNENLYSSTLANPASFWIAVVFQEQDHLQVQTKSSPVVHPTCV